MGKIIIRGSQQLTLAKSNFTDKDLKDLWQDLSKGKGTLSNLDLSETKVTSACLEDIAKMRGRGLCTLDLSGTMVKDDGLDLVSDLAGISKISLARCQITDEGVLALMPVWDKRGVNYTTGLRSLDLENTEVTDAIADRFQDANQLQFLNLQGTKLTGRGLAKIKSFVGPDCIIIK